MTLALLTFVAWGCDSTAAWAALAAFAIQSVLEFWR